LAPSRAPRSIWRRRALDLETEGGQQRPALKLASSHRPEGEPEPGTVTSTALDPEAEGAQQSPALRLGAEAEVETAACLSMGDSALKASAHCADTKDTEEAARSWTSSRAGRAADARLKTSASAPGRCAIVVRSCSSLNGWKNKEEEEKGGAVWLIPREQTSVKSLAEKKRRREMCGSLAVCI